MRIPYTNFKTRTGDDNAIGGCAFIGGEWKDVDTAEIFDNKKIVVFALPGAFTPTCSSQQLPGYEEMYDEFKAQGIDEVYCLSVNDAFVMNAWFKNQDVKKVKPLGERLLVLREEVEEKSTGGILLTHSHQEKPNQGEVKAVGDDVTTVKVGDTIVFGKYSGNETLQVDEDELIIMELKDVKAVIYE